MIDSRYRFEYFQLSSLQQQQQQIARDIYACKVSRYESTIHSKIGIKPT